MITFTCPCCGTTSTYQVQKSTKPPLADIDAIFEVVAAYFNKTPLQMQYRSRKRDNLLPRHVFIYLCRKFTKEGYKNIAKKLNIDHTTVINAVKSMQNAIDTNHASAEHIKTLIAHISNNYTQISKAA